MSNDSWPCPARSWSLVRHETSMRPDPRKASESVEAHPNCAHTLRRACRWRTMSPALRRVTSRSAPAQESDDGIGPLAFRAGRGRGQPPGAVAPTAENPTGAAVDHSRRARRPGAVRRLRATQPPRSRRPELGAVVSTRSHRFLLDALGDAVNLWGPCDELLYRNHAAARLDLGPPQASPLEIVAAGESRLERRCLRFQCDGEDYVLEIIHALPQ